ncbi:cytochrome-c peroxidase [Tunicatimonas pelagia]|uniref:cytochrome-c peroxidase n=1 Tax=Tunicatimonas pelagia TaxID=931531 RepID=UPI0026671079|nr:cytochrome c peroxidase [Tunicatimonas pelagia]WKN43473.1 cytochrome c peroxidase [Tunicatimonas pelagia]
MQKLTYIIFIIIGLVACQQAEVEPLQDFGFGALPKQVMSPKNNQNTPERAALGKLLFYDPVLSANNRISCSSCHHPSQGYADGLALSNGFGETQKTSRNSPTVLNAAFNGMDSDGKYAPSDAPMFYDNRAQSLEEQCFGPLLSPIEMMGPNVTEEEYIRVLEEKVNAIPAYQQLFYQAYGDSIITIETVAKALASFERTLITPNSPFDRFARGDNTALNAKEIRGLEAFIDAGCNTCHSGPMFSDFKLHTLGVGEHPGLALPDEGDGNYKFRTTTLRNLSFTAPYMHNGTHESLEKVMTFYEQKNSENPAVSDEELAAEFRDLNMTPFDQSRKDEIIAFLRTLDDPTFDQSIPAEVPSGLPVE